MRSLAFAAVAALVLASTGPAFADAGYSIDLRPVVEPVAVAVLSIVGILAGFAVRWVAKKIGVEKLIEDETIRGYLERAMEAGAHFALGRLRDPSFTQIETRSQAVAAAANYVVAQVPGALARFGIDQASLARMVEARLAKHEGLAVEIKPFSFEGGVSGTGAPAAST